MTTSKLRASPKSHAIYWRAFEALKALRRLSGKELILLNEDLNALPTKPGSIRVKRLYGQAYSRLITGKKLSKPRLTTRANEAVGMVYDRKTGTWKATVLKARTKRS